MVLPRGVFGRGNDAPYGWEFYLKIGRKNTRLRPQNFSRYRRELSFNVTNKYIQMAPDGNLYDFLRMQAKINFDDNKNLNVLRHSVHVNFMDWIKDVCLASIPPRMIRSIRSFLISGNSAEINNLFLFNIVIALTHPCCGWVHTKEKDETSGFLFSSRL